MEELQTESVLMAKISEYQNELKETAQLVEEVLAEIKKEFDEGKLAN
jgi:hypothetical protein